MILFSNCILNIRVFIVDLHFRVTTLEENGGGDGNSSVAELEVRVETLEGTTADHETRLTTTETDIEGKKKNCPDHQFLKSCNIFEIY